MKLMYGSVPVKSLNVHHFEMDTNDASLQPSDMQVGVTAYARGQKVVGTGKCFEFAYYGRIESNDSIIMPIDTINVVHISSLDYPTRSLILLSDMSGLNFMNGQVVCELIVDNVSYPVTVTTVNNEIIVACEASACFEIFFGKDNYV